MPEYVKMEVDPLSTVVYVPPGVRLRGVLCSDWSYCTVAVGICGDVYGRISAAVVGSSGPRRH
jgi:hypothetical protein